MAGPPRVSARHGTYARYKQHQNHEDGPPCDPCKAAAKRHDREQRALRVRRRKSLLKIIFGRVDLHGNKAAHVDKFITSIWNTMTEDERREMGVIWLKKKDREKDARDQSSD